MRISCAYICCLAACTRRPPPQANCPQSRRLPLKHTGSMDPYVAYMLHGLIRAGAMVLVYGL
jgi:hypothetical protein